MKKLYLSRRNLEALLSKLDRVKAGETSACAIIKHKHEQDPPEYMQSISELMVCAVEDEDYYKERPAGMMLPQDSPPERHQTGVAFSSLMDFGTKPRR